MFTLSRIALGAVTASALMLGGCDRQKADDGQPRPTENQATNDGTVPVAADATPSPAAADFVIDRSRKGQPVPELSFTADDDAGVALSDYRGKPLLLNLWATWCAPCVVEMPALDQLAGEVADKMQVVVVSQDLKGAEQVDPFFARQNFRNLKPNIDPDNRLSLGLGVTSLPTTLLVDSEGREVARVIGALDWHGAEARALLAEAR